MVSTVLVRLYCALRNSTAMPLLAIRDMFRLIT